MISPGAIDRLTSSSARTPGKSLVSRSDAKDRLDSRNGRRLAPAEAVHTVPTVNRQAFVVEEVYPQLGFLSGTFL